MTEKRNRQPLRLRCPDDDGTVAHAAIDVELPLSLASGLLLGLGELQCTCRQGFVVVAGGAPSRRTARRCRCEDRT